MRGGTCFACKKPLNFFTNTHNYTGLKKHTRLGILQHGSDTVNYKATEEDLHENGIDATLMNCRSDQVHQFALAQVHVHVCRSRQLELLNLLEMHFGGLSMRVAVFEIKQKD